MLTLPITEKTIDIDHVIRSKSEKLYRRIPRFIVNYLRRLLHEDELNAYLYKNREYVGIDFASAILKDFGCTIEVKGLENIKSNGRYILVANHPLGGLDGMAIISSIGTVRKDILFPVNDFLMFLPNFRPLFIPITKTGTIHPQNQQKLKEAFDSEALILYFPAGVCSRKQKGGQIRDPEWKKTFISKAIECHRDIIPLYVNGQNSKFFYNFAHLRTCLHIRFNLEQLLLVNEMFKQKGHLIRLTVGKPIPYSQLSKEHSLSYWAQQVKEYVYSLAHNPQDEWEERLDRESKTKV